MVRDVFVGAAGAMMSTALILLMLALMLSMSVRLMLARRKKAYLSLTFSLLLIAVQYVLIAALGNRPPADSGDFGHHFIHALQAVSFIVTNVGLYQLYNTTKRKVTMLAVLGTVIAFALMAAHYYADVWLLPDAGEGTAATSVVEAAAAAAGMNAFLNVWLDLYMYGLIFFCFYFVTPTIGQTGKYQLALVVFFVTHSADVLNIYVFNSASAGLSIAANFLPVVYFFILFLFIFERVLELMQAVYRSSITDGLTGLYNRRYFVRRLQQYVQAGVPVSVIFCDIDNFKRLNDTQGHQRGDETLREVAAVIMDAAEDIGIAGRFGGEEIVVMVTEPKVNPADVAESVRSRIEKETKVTVSVGWSKARKGVDGETLIKQADEAMYVSKKSGKNRATGFKAGAAPAARPPHSGG